MKRRVEQNIDGFMAQAIPLQVKTPTLFEKCMEWKGVSWVGQKSPDALKLCKEYAAKPSASKPLLLMGPSGSGKSHLMWAVANAIEDTQAAAAIEAAGAYRVSACNAIDATGATPEPWRPDVQLYDLLITNGSEIAHDLRQTIKNENLDSVISKYRQDKSHKRPILFVDDLEVMKLNEWLMEELYRIFDYRYSHCLQTFVVSNLNPEELRAHLGDRIARRLMDMTRQVVVSR